MKYLNNVTTYYLEKKAIPYVESYKDNQIKKNKSKRNSVDKKKNSLSDFCFPLKNSTLSNINDEIEEVKLLSKLLDTLSELNISSD